MLHVHLFLDPTHPPVINLCFVLFRYFVYFALCSLVGWYLVGWYIWHRFASKLVWYIYQCICVIFLIIAVNHYWTFLVIATPSLPIFSFYPSQFSGWDDSSANFVYSITFRNSVFGNQLTIKLLILQVVKIESYIKLWLPILHGMDWPFVKCWEEWGL